MGVRAQNSSMAVTGIRKADFVLFIRAQLDGRIPYGGILLVYLHPDIYTLKFYEFTNTGSLEAISI